MPEIDFFSFKRKQADEFLKAYVAAGPARLRWLRELTGLELEPGRQALADFWPWALAWSASGGHEQPTDEPMPLWWDYKDSDPYTPIEAVLVDASAYLLAESLIAANPKLHWAVLRERNAADENQPVLVGGRFPNNPRATMSVSVYNLGLIRQRGIGDDLYLQDWAQPDMLANAIAR